MEPRIGCLIARRDHERVEERRIEQHTNELEATFEEMTEFYEAEEESSPEGPDLARIAADTRELAGRLRSLDLWFDIMERGMGRYTDINVEKIHQAVLQSTVCRFLRTAARRAVSRPKRESTSFNLRLEHRALVPPMRKPQKTEKSRLKQPERHQNVQDIPISRSETRSISHVEACISDDRPQTGGTATMPFGLCLSVAIGEVQTAINVRTQSVRAVSKVPYDIVQVLGSKAGRLGPLLQYSFVREAPLLPQSRDGAEELAACEDPRAARRVVAEGHGRQSSQER